MKHLNYLGVLVIFLSLFHDLSSQVSFQDSNYDIRPLFELDQLATGEAYPWISDDGLRLYYTAFNTSTQSFAVWYSERSDINNTFDSHRLLSINSPQTENLSSCLSSDEKVIIFARRTNGEQRDTDIRIAYRDNLNEAFGPSYSIEFPEKIKGTLLSPSFTPDLNQLILFNEYKGHAYILIFEKTDTHKYKLKSELKFPKQFIVKAGKLSNDGLEYYISLQEGRRNPGLFVLKRQNLNEDFVVVDKIMSDILNDKTNRNHQAHFSSNKDFIVFTQSSENEWDSNGIYIVQNKYFKPETVEQEFIHQEILSDIVLFPNPSVDNVYFKNVENKQLRIEIFDATGSLVKLLEDVKNEELVSIADLKSGSYYFRIIDMQSQDFRVIKHIKL